MQKTKLILAAAGFSAIAFVSSCTSQQNLAGSGSTNSTTAASSNAESTHVDVRTDKTVQVQQKAGQNENDTRIIQGKMPKAVK